jgi:hypothetical protein
MEHLINVFGCAEIVILSLRGPRTGSSAAKFAGSRPPSAWRGGFRTDSSSCHQPPSHEKQVAEREEREELGAVLGKALVAGLHVAELALEDSEGMARRERRNSVQNVSASEGPMPRPMISRRPLVFAATAIMAATGTIRPPWRTFR